MSDNENKDIATRLRQTRADMLGTDDEEHYWDCHEAAAEIERLRGKLAWTERERDSLRVAIQNLAVPGGTLTDAERQLIGRLSDRFEAMGNFDRRPSSPGVSQECEQDAATLRGLLERLA